MAKKMTNKTPLFGNLRSHACNSTRHAQRPNYQKVTLEDGSKVVVTARDLRTMRKQNKIAA